MSDTPEGLGWWQASDGKWYPPEQAQDSAPTDSEPSIETEPTAEFAATAAVATPTPPEQNAPPPVDPPWWRSGWALAIAAVVVLVTGFAVGALLLSSDDDGETAVETTPTDDSTPQPTETPSPTPTEEPTSEPTEAPTEEPTAPPTEAPTEEPSASPTATATPEPTEEPTESPSPAPDPEALEFSGTGSDEIVLDPPLEGEPLIITTEHVGSGNFIVEGLDEFDEINGFYANAIDSWFGTVPMNWEPGDTVSKLVIDAGGDWTIVIQSSSQAPQLSSSSGSTYDGASFEVLVFEVDEETVVEFECAECQADVLINAHGDDLFENLVDATADDGFTATLDVPAGTEFLEVRAFAELRATPPTWTLTVD